MSASTVTGATPGAPTSRGASPSAPTTPSTPTIRTVLRRARFWIGLAAALAIIALIASALLSTSSSGRPLDPDAAAPTGARALVKVLEAQGVEVEPLGNAEEVRDAVRDETTVFVADVEGVLSPERLQLAVGRAERVVLVQPDSLVLEGIAPEIGQTGGLDGAKGADCGLPAAERAERIDVEGTGYRLLDGEEGELCFGYSDGAALAQVQDGTQTVTVIGTGAVFSNEGVDELGAAALALGLLGETAHVVWYLPDASDLETAALPTPDELLPRWVNPAILLAMLTGLLVLFWRGRRLGPLVVERLPAIVRASETMEGRARLYARDSARLHALDSLRIGTVRRLAARVGLPRTASVAEVVDAVAAVIERPRDEVAAALVDADPASDAELLRISDDLLLLEQFVADATTPT